MAYEKLTDEQIMQNRIDRRENRDYANMLADEAKAEPLIGELVREGKVVYYINVRSLDGRLTGKTKEFTGPVGRYEAIDYLIRNHYV
jgi:hypothetical protein